MAVRSLAAESAAGQVWQAMAHRSITSCSRMRRTWCLPSPRLAAPLPLGVVRDAADVSATLSPCMVVAIFARRYLTLEPFAKPILLQPCGAVSHGHPDSPLGYHPSSWRSHPNRRNELRCRNETAYW